MFVKLHNTQSRDVKGLSVGFDWPAFFSPFIFGVPHLLRGMYMPGGVLVALNILFLFQSSGSKSAEDLLAMGVIQLLLGAGFGVYLGLTGRQHYAKHLLKNGYDFAEPEAEQTQIVKQQWGIL